MVQAYGLMGYEMYDWKYTPLCIIGCLGRTPNREYSKAALRMAHKEVSPKPWPRNMLPGWAQDILNTPYSLSDSRPVSPQHAVDPQPNLKRQSRLLCQQASSPASGVVLPVSTPSIAVPPIRRRPPSGPRSASIAVLKVVLLAPRSPFCPFQHPGRPPKVSGLT